MGNRNLEEILKRKKEGEQDKEKIDWVARKKEWIEYVNSFFTQVGEWLKSYRDKELLKMKTEKLRISEEYMGEYEIDQLIIEVPGEQVLLTPIGTIIIGAHGRIDMHGKRGTMIFLLVGENQDEPYIETLIYVGKEERKQDREERKAISSAPIKYVWKFATSPPRIRYIELSEDVFSDLFERMING